MDQRQLDEKIWVGPQIRPEDVSSLKEKGIELIINNRPDGEEAGQPTSAEIEAAAKEAGIEYIHNPVYRGPSYSDVEAMEDALEKAGEKKIFAFCRSGTRSTLTWAIARAEQGCDRAHLERCAEQAGYDLKPVAHLL
ncbi:TIGR01244 family sulfur transferase [Sphingomicrobium lutaoense]|uniref:Uncharacterized protein (TIGR01244 family) n=1 Tax=Sphingomicrobium lutaoense TaxID=515949 RepID=A0A839Z516_9SPHN|nr:TIGR01244 family sulfur transferase [Sphingomicrobium lutaoense]MBB3764745.1 uncharacterized protein (TIGR01244 family) [Sphingomicrobium lutaoense]